MIFISHPNCDADQTLLSVGFIPVLFSEGGSLPEQKQKHSMRKLLRGVFCYSWHQVELEVLSAKYLCFTCRLGFNCMQFYTSDPLHFRGKFSTFIRCLKKVEDLKKL